MSMTAPVSQCRNPQCSRGGRPGWTGDGGPEGDLAADLAVDGPGLRGRGRPRWCRSAAAACAPGCLPPSALLPLTALIAQAHHSDISLFLGSRRPGSQAERRRRNARIAVRYREQGNVRASWPTLVQALGHVAMGRPTVTRYTASAAPSSGPSFWLCSGHRQQRHHEHVTLVAFIDGRHWWTSATRRQSASCGLQLQPADAAAGDWRPVPPDRRGALLMPARSSRCRLRSARCMPERAVRRRAAAVEISRRCRGDGTYRSARHAGRALFPTARLPPGYGTSGTISLLRRLVCRAG